ncbi:Integrator complex subunit 2 [Bulinus truncatus]|nr:Integrator complex subunit 2 [Bulinus truncatus]
MQVMDIETLNASSDSDLRPILPGLVRMALCAPLDASDKGKEMRKMVLAILSRLQVVNSIVDMLSIDFHALEQDVKKEQQLRNKMGGSLTDSVLVSQLTHGVALEFERSESDPAQRIRLLLSQLLFISSELTDQRAGNYFKQSDLFESPVYTEEILDALCIAMAVCNSLISRGEKQEEDSPGGLRRLELLRMLCLINPKAALVVRNYCAEYCNMPGFAVAVSLQLAESSHLDDLNASDIVPFFTSLLLGSDVTVRNWFSSFVKAGLKRKSDCMLSLLRSYLLQQLISMTPVTGQMIEASKIVAASSLLRLYNALKGIATLKYSDEETGCLLRLIISHPVPCTAGAHFIALGICTLIASPGLLRSLDDEQSTVSWLRWLVQSDAQFDRISGSTDSPGEMLFLLALHFHNNQMLAITDLVCNTLGMKITVKTSALVKIRHIFTMELFTEQVVAAHAVKIPVTPNLDVKSTGYLPVHSILQLLKSRVFSKHKVSIRKWVYRQICNSSFPLHPLLPQLIESYVNSVIPKTSKPEHTNEPLSESKILALFDMKKRHMAVNEVANSVSSPGYPDIQEKLLCPQLLILYYLLLYEDLYQTHKKLIDVTKLSLYSDTVMSQIPISYLVQEALKQHNNCQNLFPPMIRLLNTHFPHLCLVEDWLDSHVGLMTKDQQSAKRKHTGASTFIRPEKIREALSAVHVRPSQAIKLLEELISCGETTVLRMCQDAIVSGLASLLQEGTPRRLLDLTKKVWFKMHSLTPRKLRLDTIKSLQPSKKSIQISSQLTEQDLVIDPLVVLRCEDRVFRCAPILEILLRILSAYTQASRSYLNAHVLDAVETEKEKDRLELKVALLAAQESAIVQILLEVCLPLESEKNKSQGELSSLREVRCLIFSYIHQVFIADPNLAKLVHFQGYPYELLPLVVAGVPSMHICLDFIPELIGQPQRSKQIFGIQLLAHLCTQYHLPKSMNIAKLGIDVMFTLLTVLEKGEWVAFFRQTVPSLLPICEAFPPLGDDVTTLLSQLGRVCYSQMTVVGNASRMYLHNEKVKESPVRSTDQLLCDDYDALYSTVEITFKQICNRALVIGKLY